MTQTRSLYIAAQHKPPAQSPSRQRGFSLVELGIVLSITIIITIVGIPRIQGYLVESRAPHVASELKRFIARAKVMGESDSATPYTGMDNTRNLAPALAGSSVMRLTGDTVSHRLGGRGAGSHGTVTLAAADLDGAGAGSAFSLTLSNVSEYACPLMATLMHPVSEAISLNGDPVKGPAADGSPGDYHAVMAQESCRAGEANTFVFVTR